MGAHHLLGATISTTIPLSEAQWRALVVVLAGETIGKRVSPGRRTSHVFPWHLQIAGNVKGRLEELGLVHSRYEGAYADVYLRWIVPTAKLRDALARNPKLTADADAEVERLRAILDSRKAGQ